MELERDEYIRKEIYDAKREIMKLMIMVENKIWKEERKKRAKGVV